ncbi:putative Rab-GTPase-TBC domain containing protein [Blattamonas nauphoetae]|uniref:Rab-GTPase-TBC domain containing protein n=1 Tax=Blattamonas nauphoetae TaxID=2049346 RepID=A0ABQ9YHU8_9EUKA|nr:putative Rab-GTPase-TBC domain containing protein [Blattamonas nauphoetae]
MEPKVLHKTAVDYLHSDGTGTKIPGVLNTLRPTFSSRSSEELFRFIYTLIRQCQGKRDNMDPNLYYFNGNTTELSNTHTILMNDNVFIDLDSPNPRSSPPITNQQKGQASQQPSSLSSSMKATQKGYVERSGTDTNDKISSDTLKTPPSSKEIDSNLIQPPLSPISSPKQDEKANYQRILESMTWNDYMTILQVLQRNKSEISTFSSNLTISTVDHDSIIDPTLIIKSLSNPLDLSSLSLYTHPSGAISYLPLLLTQIILNGVHPLARPHIWPLLFNIYPDSSSQVEKTQMKNKMNESFFNLQLQIRMMIPEQIYLPTFDEDIDNGGIDIAHVSERGYSPSSFNLGGRISSRLDSFPKRTWEHDELNQKHRTPALQLSSPIPFISDSFRRIELDLKRSDREQETMMDGDDSMFYQDTRKILQNQMMLDPELGYVQGMNDLISLLLHAYVGDSVLAFYSFSGLINSLRAFFYSPSSLTSFFHILFSLLLLVDPELAHHLLFPPVDPRSANFGMRQNSPDSQSSFSFSFLFSETILLLKRSFTFADTMRLWEAMMAFGLLRKKEEWEQWKQKGKERDQIQRKKESDKSEEHLPQSVTPSSQPAKNTTQTTSPINSIPTSESGQLLKSSPTAFLNTLHTSLIPFFSTSFAPLPYASIHPLRRANPQYSYIPDSMRLVHASTLTGWEYGMTGSIFGPNDWVCIDASTDLTQTQLDAKETLEKQKKRDREIPSYFSTSFPLNEYQVLSSPFQYSFIFSPTSHSQIRLRKAEPDEPGAIQYKSLTPSANLPLITNPLSPSLTLLPFLLLAYLLSFRNEILEKGNSEPEIIEILNRHARINQRQSKPKDENAEELLEIDQPTTKGTANEPDEDEKVDVEELISSALSLYFIAWEWTKKWRKVREERKEEEEKFDAVIVGDHEHRDKLTDSDWLYEVELLFVDGWGINSNGERLWECIPLESEPDQPKRSHSDDRKVRVRWKPNTRRATQREGEKKKEMEDKTELIDFPTFIKKSMSELDEHLRQKDRTQVTARTDKAVPKRRRFDMLGIFDTFNDNVNNLLGWQRNTEPQQKVQPKVDNTKRKVEPKQTQPKTTPVTPPPPVRNVQLKQTPVQGKGGVAFTPPHSPPSHPQPVSQTNLYQQVPQSSTHTSTQIHKSPSPSLVVPTSPISHNPVPLDSSFKSQTTPSPRTPIPPSSQPTEQSNPFIAPSTASESVFSQFFETQFTPNTAQSSETSPMTQPTNGSSDQFQNDDPFGLFQGSTSEEQLRSTSQQIWQGSSVTSQQPQIPENKTDFDWNQFFGSSS